ncbi:MAG TPA: hypothetical protein VF339_04485 [Gammaproteobacteria bacterium]
MKPEQQRQVICILHEIQLSQERLVLDAESYAEDELISRLRGR